MKRWLMAASLLAVFATGTQAADLDDNDGPYDRYGSAYDDPRYADVYRHPGAPPYGDKHLAPPYAGPPAAPPYADKYGPPPFADKRYPPPYADEDVYGPPPVPPYPGYKGDDPGRRFSYAEPRYPDCVPRALIRHRLAREGWLDFHEPELAGDLVIVKARRPSGELFVLTIARCTGELVEARPLYAAPYGPYASVPGPFTFGPRRWARPF
jgi:hypothetical protein